MTSTESIDASPAEVDYELTQGDDETWQITKTDSNGNAVDISNWTFWLTIKNNYVDSDSDAVVQKKVTSHTDPTNGITEIDLTSSDTEPLDKSYWYDMQYKDDTGTINTFMEGRMHFQSDVTKDTT